MKNMQKIIALCASLSVLGSVVVAASGQTMPKDAKKPAKAAVKLVDVWTCPIEGGAVADHTVKSTDPVVGKYRVHFCCAGCPAEFAKLSAKDKLAKVQAAAKKDAAPAKKSA
jgi:hypothetical protein